MRSLRSTLCGVLVAGAALVPASAALASPAHTPYPTAGTPSCAGLVVADTNHGSGGGAPRSPNSSAGPGVFLGPGTQSAIAAARADTCTP